MAQPQRIVSNRYPYLDIRVTIGDWRGESSALPDTGFTAELVVPETLLNQDIGFPDEHIAVEVGDGRIVNSPVYLGAIEIPGLSTIPDVTIIAIGNEFIIGRGIIDLFRVTFEHGARVTVET
jgi:predicted aspartyl protease